MTPPDPFPDPEPGHPIIIDPPIFGTGSRALWIKPAAVAIPREGYFELERGRYGPVYPAPRFATASRSSPKSKRAAKRLFALAVSRSRKRSRAAPMCLRPCGCTTSGGCCSTSARACTFSTRASSTPTSTSTPRTPWNCAARPASPQCSPTLRGSRGTGRKTRRLSSSSSASTTARAFSNTVSIPTSRPTRSRRRCGSRRRSPTCSTGASYNQNYVPRQHGGAPANQHLLDVQLPVGGPARPRRDLQPLLHHHRGPQRRVAELRDRRIEAHHGEPKN